MRHRKRRGKLKVSPSHWRAMRRNLVASLFEHGAVTTTVAKAKAFRPFAEKLITLARRGNGSLESEAGRAGYVHAVRRAAQLLPHKPAIRKLFRDVAPAVGDRPGGYTRIVRLGTSRLGDRSQLVKLMLVDAPGAEAPEEAEEAEEKRGRKGGKKEKAKEQAANA